MNTAAFYGFGTALAGAVLMLVFYALGFHTDKLETGQAFGWLGLLIPIIGISLGLRENKRDAVEENKPVTFGGAFGHALLIAVFWGAGGAIVAYIYYGFINTEMIEFVIAAQQEQLSAQGIPEANMEQAENITRKMFLPWVQAILSFLISIVLGVIIGLIASGFFRHTPVKKPVMGADAEVPASE